MGASIQDTYGKRPKGFLGGIANSNPLTTKSVTTAEQIAVGKFCTFSASGIINLTGLTNTIAGVVCKSDAMDGATVEANENATLLEAGNVFVYSETACNEGDTVYARVTANGALAVGNVRNDADNDGTNDRAVAVKAIFEETLTGAGLVQIKVTL